MSVSTTANGSFRKTSEMELEKKEKKEKKKGTIKMKKIIQKTKRARTLVSPCCVGSLRDACTTKAIVSEDNDSLLFSWLVDVSSREG